MGTDEMIIYDFLKSAPNDYVMEREISRRAAGKKRFREDANWARSVLFRMVKDEVLETDGCGHYRIKLRAKINTKPEKLTMENWDKWQLVLDDPAENRKDSNQH